MTITIHNPSYVKFLSQAWYNILDEDADTITEAVIFVLLYRFLKPFKVTKVNGFVQHLQSRHISAVLTGKYLYRKNDEV